MAGELQLRDVDDDIIPRLLRRAIRNGRTVEAEHHEILRQALAAEVTSTFSELAAECRAMMADRKHTPSEILQREGREER